MAIAIDKIRAIFGADVDWKEDNEIDVANIADQIWARNNPDRLFLSIINLSANNIFIRPHEAATSTTGILLVPSGGSFTVIVRDDAILPIIEWHVIAGADASAIYSLEIVGVRAIGEPSGE